MNDSMRRFGRWWVGELKACVPLRLRNRLRSRHPSLRIRVGEASIELCREGDGEARRLGIVPHPRPGLPEEAMTLIAKEFAPETTRVIVDLGERQFLRRVLRLPIEAEATLQDVIGFEIEQWSPFRADDLYLGYRVLERHPAERTLSVELKLAPRETVAEAAAVIEGWRLTPVEPIAHLGENGPSFPIVLTDERFQQPTASRLTIGLSAINVALLLAALAAPAYQRAEYLTYLEAQLSETREAAGAAIAADDRLSAVNTELDVLDQHTQATALRIALLDELTGVLDDRTWLQQLDIENDRIEISGTSDSASNVVTALNTSPLFTSPRFAASVDRDSTTGQERFRISALIGGGSP